MPGFDLDALKTRTRAAAKITYRNQSDSDFFNLENKDHFVRDGVFQADIKLLAKPGTKGFAHCIVHKNVGFPGKDARTFKCPRSSNIEEDCVICTVCDYAQDDELFMNADTGEVATMDWPIRKKDKSREVVVVSVPIPTIIKGDFAQGVDGIMPRERLILTVCEPKHINNPDSPKHLRGPQVWFCDTKSLQTKILDCLTELTPDYFTDMKSGRLLRITYDKNKTDKREKYSVLPFKEAAIPDSILKECPDPEQFTGKIRERGEMITKLRDMFGDNLTLD